MHLSNEKGQPNGEPHPAQESEMSEAFRALLGLQSSEGTTGAQDIDPAAQVPPQESDPWSHLLQAQGMQPVDLQKLRLRDLHKVRSNDDDVEHALNIMREATGQLSSLDEHTREA